MDKANEQYLFQAAYSQQRTEFLNSLNTCIQKKKNS